MTAAIQLQHVAKAFGKRTAVHDLSLTVPEGSIFGLLGHNGAGKSTTLGMLLGQVYPDTGTVTLHGHNVFTYRRDALAHVGAIFESPCFYAYLTGYQNLKALIAYSTPTPKKRLDEVVEMAGLTDRIHHKVATYSHGMRQRLALAQALLPNPKTLILDEPTDGLDPQGIAELRKTLLHLNRDLGLTLLFSSHLLSEVEHLATDLAVLHQGHLVFQGAWDPSKHDAKQVRLHVDQPGPAITQLIEANLIQPMPSSESPRPFLVTLTDAATPADLNRLLHQHGHAVHELTPLKPTLESFYLQTITPPAPEPSA
ncbi:MAG: ABC transporter ATP-binding protein [Planctomycetota bacterium]